MCSSSRRPQKKAKTDILAPIADAEHDGDAGGDGGDEVDDGDEAALASSGNSG